MHFQSLTVHTTQKIPLISTYLLSVSLQAKIFGAYFTVPSGRTDQRPENIKALQLPYCSQPVRLAGIDTVSPVPIYAYFNSLPKKDSASSPCKPSLTLQT